MDAWWKHRTIYQIYLRSFYDSNHDGIGDLLGIKAKLPYLKALGIGIIWISPHYDSPMDDNGYDVRDFYKVSNDYGTLDDFKALMTAAHDLDIKVITDLVLNHTSDEHPWFLAAKDPSHPDFERYHHYYIWQKPRISPSGIKERPTRWMGWFGSPTWDYNDATDEYYLHIFSKKMPDLNWRNAAMREDIMTMIQWWVDLGVDGFRVDASNHLEKNWDFPDAFPGYEHFSSLPKHHEYLQELGRRIFVPNDLLSIGESGGASQEEALKYAGYGSNEFNMLIQFGHCWADVFNHNPKLMGKWAQGTLDIRIIKNSFNNWYQMLNQQGWNVVYWHNHDQPRVVSHYGDDQTYRDVSAKMLAIALYVMPGSAICYQGEEIGMANVTFDSIDQFRDVEVFTEFENMKQRGMSAEEALDVIRNRCRDNARTPMQWDSEPFAGFSSVQPWINCNSDFKQYNVANQENDPKSVLSLYRYLLNLRNQDHSIADGQLVYLDKESLQDFSYLNSSDKGDYLVLCNFSKLPLTMTLSIDNLEAFSYVIGNQNDEKPLAKTMELSPYEAHVYRRNHS